MINEDQIKNALLHRNKNFSSRQRNIRNDIEKELERNKERINRSQRVNTNHFVYCSKYSNVRNTSYRGAIEKDKSNKANNLIDDEGLDHPIPLISDCEENFEELKSQFITKKIRNEYINNDLKIKKLKNARNLEDGTETYLAITSREATDSNELQVETNENIYNNNKENK